MRHSLTFSFLLISVFLFGQKDFGAYLEGLDRGGNSSLEDLSKEVMKPEYKESLETNYSLVESYISEAQRWTTYSDTDILAWKSSIIYLMALGYEMNDFGKETGEPIFYLTSVIRTDTSADVTSNKYKLNTSLFELGGRSDVVAEGGSYFDLVLQEENLESPMLAEYFLDFKTWPLKRKRDWLFLFFETDMEFIQNEMLVKLLTSEYFDLDIRSKNGKLNLFDVAVEAGNYKGANALIENGFNVNLRCFDCNGETPMHKLVVLKDPALGPESLANLIAKLLANGADLDLRDMDTLTPIHLAIKEKNIEAFKAFMAEDVVFTANLADDKDLHYMQFFEKHWTDDREDDFLIMLQNKTSLKPKPTKEEAKQMKKEAKAKKKADKEADKAKRKKKKKKKK